MHTSVFDAQPLACFLCLRGSDPSDVSWPFVNTQVEFVNWL